MTLPCFALDSQPNSTPAFNLVCFAIWMACGEPFWRGPPLRLDCRLAGEALERTAPLHKGKKVLLHSVYVLSHDMIFI